MLSKGCPARAPLPDDPMRAVRRVVRGRARGEGAAQPGLHGARHHHGRRPSLVRIVLCKKLVPDPGYAVFLHQLRQPQGRRARREPVRPPPCSTGTPLDDRYGWRAASCVPRTTRKRRVLRKPRARQPHRRLASLQSQPLDSRKTLLKRGRARGRSLRHPRAATRRTGAGIGLWPKPSSCGSRGRSASTTGRAGRARSSPRETRS